MLIDTCLCATTIKAELAPLLFQLREGNVYKISVRINAVEIACVVVVEPKNLPFLSRIAFRFF